MLRTMAMSAARTRTSPLYLGMVAASFALCALVILLLAKDDRIPWIGTCRTAPERMQTYYMAHCSDARYADYEHGAFALETEEVQTAAKAADVLLFGNSRLQFAFSAPGVSEFFHQIGARHYLMGFSYDEGSRFPAALVQRWGLRPKAIIINVDPFFARASTFDHLVQDPGLADRVHYAVKRWQQQLQQQVCRDGGEPLKSWLCNGRSEVILRSRIDGSWATDMLDKGQRIPVSYQEKLDPARVRMSLTEAESFLTLIGVPRECVFFTTIPSNSAIPQLAAEVAKAVGVSFEYREPAHLTTLDQDHLSVESAKLWSGIYLNSIREPLERCTGSGPGIRVASPTAASHAELSPPIPAAAARRR